MPTAIIDGIATRYEVIGSGPPILMYSPAGFDATLDKWRTQGIYAKIKLLDRLPKTYTCITFDRRETGQSGGRVERITWAHYVAQGAGLLDHLKIDRAHIMGGCMGVPCATAFGTIHSQRVLSLILYWPVGGAKYRISSHQRFATHLGYLNEHSLADVVALATSSGKSFGEDPRGGPWAAVLRSDRVFAEAYAKQDLEKYKLIVAGMARTMFDRDTAPGAEPEDLLRCDLPALVVPGRDAAHATSAARYLEECLPKSDYWDVPVAGQTEQATNKTVIAFCNVARSRRNRISLRAFKLPAPGGRSCRTIRNCRRWFVSSPLPLPPFWLAAAWLLHPSVMVPRWPWQLSPFTARFLGAFYLAEMSAVVILAVINRWSPGRLLLISAASFTAIISAVSLWHIDRFNFGRLGPWAWFVLYVGSAFIAAAFLWTHRRLPHPGRPFASPAWRAFFVVQALLLGVYGLFLLVAPETATSIWPWKLPSFDAQLYSTIFLTSGIAAYVLSRSPGRAELAAFGLSEVVLGVLAILGLYLADATAKVVNWTDSGTIIWIAGYVVLAIMGVISMALAARRPA